MGDERWETGKRWLSELCIFNGAGPMYGAMYDSIHCGKF